MGVQGSAEGYPRFVVKRDGRVVPFDPNRIRNAVRRAMLAVNQYDAGMLDAVITHILGLISQRFGVEGRPHVEEIQDLVELSLVKFGLYHVAKAYIVYRKEREQIRYEKMKLLEKDYVDEVDKAFSLNAIRLMASRYLQRDERGRLVEGPKQMFERVAALIVISDILHDPLVFSRDGGQPVHELGVFEPEVWERRVGLGRRQDGGYEVLWNRWHLERMRALYEELNRQGRMRLPWSEFFEKLVGGAFDHHYREYLEYYSLMVEKKFMPNSPTLFNAGTKLGQLSACFVLPIDDSIESIMKAATEAAIIFKSGGGIGINYSRLRPEGDRVLSTGGVASGPVSFMQIIDTITDVVKQGGKRRGANMGILEIQHPDIEKFVRAKEAEGVLENFNISVLVEDGFWRHLETGEPYPLINPRDGSVWGRADPRYLFHLIAEMAWRTADPGVLFLENINKHNPLRPALGEIRCTNPCGEEPLYPYEPCNLGSLNLFAFVKWDGGRASVDWEGLAQATRVAYRFLDNVIDVNRYPTRETDEMAKRTRRVGLGLMGLGDLLYSLGIPYNSEEGFEMMQRLTEFVAWHAYRASAERARERGPFPLYGESIYTRGDLPLPGYHRRELWTMNWDEISSLVREGGIRNSFLMSIAPTGSISMLVDTSSGLEPVFALVYEKRVTVGVFYYVDPAFERYLREKGLYSEGLLKVVAENGGSIQGLEQFDEEARRVFVVAYDIPWWDHVRAQYHVNLWVDAAVSKTINMPSWVTPQDVGNAILFAHRLGLKGLTIYRDASKSGQVLVTPTQRTNRYVTPVQNKTLDMARALGLDFGSPAPAAALERGAAKGLAVGGGQGGCPSCGASGLVYQESCVRCMECGWSSCVVA